MIAYPKERHKMNSVLIPQPQQLRRTAGTCSLSAAPVLGIPNAAWRPAADAVRQALPKSSIHAAAPGPRYDVRWTCDPRQPEEGYRLTIAPAGVTIASATPRAGFWGAQTLRQILAQSPGGCLPCMEITDAPDFHDRGYYYDLARGRVPTMGRLKELIDLLAAHKMNHLQFYIEHTFAYHGHPDIGKNASPLSAQDILDLDDHAARQYVELVPSLATFGHLSPVLSLPQYHDLAEDFGVGRYRDTEGVPPWAVKWLRAWTLSPANPRIYPFLDSLFAEFLPLFRSKRFNVCCDETWDLGCGQSYELAKKIGKGELYVRHLLKLYELCGKYGKQMMFWGDIIRHHPELIKKLPRDAVVLDWGYGYNHKFDSIADFRKSGLPFMACPSTSSYVAFFPRAPQSRANVHGFAVAAKREGALGILNTEWGDGGHYNFLECSWPETLYGAEQSWNTGADVQNYTARFLQTTMRLPASDCAKAARTLDRLGEISFLSADGYYQSALRHIFFAKTDDPIVSGKEFNLTLCEKGVIRTATQALDARCGAELARELKTIRAQMLAWRRNKGCDPLGLLPYWIFAADCMHFAACKLVVLTGARNTPAQRRKLAMEQGKLLERFRTLWLARNQRSEIGITIKGYRKAIASLNAGR